jgi:alanine dehydrogenase
MESKMRVGVPKEIKVHEYRVGLTPPSVSELVSAGHEVIVQTNAGSGIDFEDQDYIDAGARIAPDAASTFAQADMIVKVKEPQPQEIACSRRATCSSPISTSRRTPIRHTAS